MPETSEQTSTRTLGRRSFLGTVGATALGAAVFSERASASYSSYETINIVDAGADNTGGDSITPILDDVLDDNRKIYFPPGEYYIDEGIRFTGFDKLWLIGDDATIVPAPADEFEGEHRIFKLGTHYAPGDWLRIGYFTFDFRAHNTGLRAIQAQVNDCYIHDIDFVGEHDAGTHGPMLVDIVDEDSIGAVDRVRMPDGGAWTKDTEQDGNPDVRWGPTGFIVSPYHSGKLWVRDCVIGGFPDNGLYDSGEDGRVVVRGGRFENSNSANIRLDGHRSTVQDATVVVDHARSRDNNQRGIRLDGGSNCWIENCEIILAEPNGHAITVMPGCTSAKIENTSITLGASDESNDAAIMVSEGCGDVEIEDVHIEMHCPGQAIDIEPGDGDVLVEGCTVTGEASGATGGRNAIRCERDGSRFYSNTVEQPGPSYRRALALVADDCVVSKGSYESTHHPIVDDGNGNVVSKTTARSYDGYDGLKVASGDVDLYWSTVYEGVAGSYDGYGNEFPS
ncbi:Right handed beta helix region [Halogranum amylolyticum]|uniref:Right handed beta helix region n=1 Tax=Halogranum amylolyticum TaxID=660520 RepID=A0A1H8W4H7_9EURY|nr:right-handed parallel beta-helix repeat-containing protein [Halogranum amylolyticum]SEP22552.1 Right handed beta helix region [Halogranum amylolyticum]